MVKFKNDNALTMVSSSAFGNCTSLNSIQLSTLGWTGGSSASNIPENAFNNCGLKGGTITGIGAHDLLDAIRARNTNWLPGWVAIEQP